MPDLYTISKSSFLKGLQCDKHLYLYKYHKEWIDPLSEMQQAIFARGTDVGKLAQKLFPGGTDASPKSFKQFDKSIAKTKKLLKKKNVVIYEASFVFDQVYAAADIVVKKGNSIKIYEVKSSTSVSDVNIYDTSVQYWIITNLGYDVEDISMVYINNQYVRDGKLDLNQLFNIQSVSENVLEKQEFVNEEIVRQKELLSKSIIPKVDIGMHCTDPYQCGFMGYCWKDIPGNSIFDISGMHLRKKFELYERGVVKIEDIPNDVTLNPNQKLQIDGTLNGKTIIDKDAIHDFLSTINYPLFFIDFESFQPAVPLYNNSKPYQQIPFQFSAHYKSSHEDNLKHYELLAEPDKDPRIPFIEELIKVLSKPGDILVYNKAFEITRLKEIARDHPKYKKKIENIIARIKDLMIPFQKKYYYKPEMNGSYSIKYVLPALVPELSYSELSIADGGTASLSYENLSTLDDFIKIQEIKNNLLEYCKLDTLAMVKILEKLEEV